MKAILFRQNSFICSRGVNMLIISRYFWFFQGLTKIVVNFKIALGTRLSGAWKFHVNDSKSCKVNFCCCSFTGAFKGLRANFLLSRYFSMNLLVRRSAKYLLTRGWSQDKKWHEQTFQKLVMRSTISFPNGIRAMSWKCVGPECSPAPSSVEKQFDGHVSEYLCKWLDSVYRCEDFTFHFTSSLYKCKHH